MLYFFYHLYFKHETDKDEEGNSITNTYNIGYFSTKAKAENQIQVSRNLPGFRDHLIDCFKIEKLGVNFEVPIKDKSLVDFYVLSHEYYDGEYDRPITFPPFATKKEAMNKKKELEKIKPYCDHLDDFFLDKHCVDRDNGWPGGFRKIDEEDEAHANLFASGMIQQLDSPEAIDEAIAKEVAKIKVKGAPQ